jgi:hypothetical protein
MADDDLQVLLLTRAKFAGKTINAHAARCACQSALSNHYGAAAVKPVRNKVHGGR